MKMKKNHIVDTYSLVHLSLSIFALLSALLLSILWKTHVLLLSLVGSWTLFLLFIVGNNAVFTIYPVTFVVFLNLLYWMLLGKLYQKHEVAAYFAAILHLYVGYSISCMVESGTVGLPKSLTICILCSYSFYWLVLRQAWRHL